MTEQEKREINEVIKEQLFGVCDFRRTGNTNACNKCPRLCEEDYTENWHLAVEKMLDLGVNIVFEKWLSGQSSSFDKVKCGISLQKVKPKGKRLNPIFKAEAMEYTTGEAVCTAIASYLKAVGK
jgi:hypothetical protein